MIGDLVAYFFDWYHYRVMTTKGLWKGDSSTFLSSKSFLKCLTSISHDPLFPIAKFIWKAKVHDKVRAFVWTMAFQKINTNDMLQKSRPGLAISPTVFELLCKQLDQIFSFIMIPCASLE